MIFKREKEETEELKKPKKIIKEDDGMEWDKKRVGIALLVLIIGFFVAYELKNNFYNSDAKVLGDSVKNKSTQFEKPDVRAPINFSSEIENTIEDVKKNVLTLNPEEVASTSPQIQKVLRDIQGIKDLPENEAKEMCQKICSGI